jgi:hypothetical protein
MDVQEIKKDVKNIQVSKNAIICGLLVALVLVSAVAIGLAGGGEEDGGRGEERDNGRMEQRYDDNNANPNDGETNDDQSAPVDQNTKPASTTTPTNPVAPQVTPKQ